MGASRAGNGARGDAGMEVGLGGGLVVFACATVFPAAASAQTFEPNVNRWGSDYRSFEPETPDARLCQTACIDLGKIRDALDQQVRVTAIGRALPPRLILLFSPHPRAASRMRPRPACRQYRCSSTRLRRRRRGCNCDTG